MFNCSIVLISPSALTIYFLFPSSMSPADIEIKTIKVRLDETKCSPKLDIDKYNKGKPYIFTGTIRENIIYNHTEVTEHEMISASKAVGSHDLIMKLPQQYRTMLEERGSNLSLGERQLISFARALVANPKILILDEATASIDSHTEKMIQKALSKLLVGRTSIIIAHRLSTIRDADNIIVLRDGAVVEEGKHNELVAAKGLYKVLHDNNLASLSGV